MKSETKKQRINRLWRENYHRKMSDPAYAAQARKKERDQIRSNPREALRRKYHAMKKRCENRNDKDYDRYGRFGIKIEWSCFEDFYKDKIAEFLVLFNAGEKSICIDRIDPTKNYSKANTRFTTFSENSTYNKKTNRYITYKGRRMIIADWARELGVARQSIRYRLEKGWTAEQIIETPFSYSNRISV